jgi:TPR repeat protein
VEQNDAEAFRWYRQSAEQGYAGAMCALGRFCEGGVLGPRDQEQALSWYQKGADAGSADAFYQLARCYAEGIGVTEDREKAALLCRQALEHEPEEEIRSQTERLLQKLNH